MIDREARRRLASALKRLATGKITDYEFQGLIERFMDSNDPALAEVATRFYIGYDSSGFVPPVQYGSKHPMRKNERKAIIRAILFLRGEYETAATSIKGSVMLMAFIFILASFIIADYPQWTLAVIAVILIGVPVLGTAFWRIRERLVDSIWPFKNRADYKAALRRPYLGAQRLLNS